MSTSVEKLERSVGGVTRVTRSNRCSKLGNCRAAARPVPSMPGRYTMSGSELRPARGRRASAEGKAELRRGGPESVATAFMLTVAPVVAGADVGVDALAADTRAFAWRGLCVHLGRFERRICEMQCGFDFAPRLTTIAAQFQYFSHADTSIV